MCRVCTWHHIPGFFPSGKEYVLKGLVLGHHKIVLFPLTFKEGTC